MTSVRSPVVDDFVFCHNFVPALFDNRSDLTISGVTYRGLEVIQKTADLQLNLVLLDISLQDMNGIQAADRLRQLVRKGKIIFVKI